MFLIENLDRLFKASSKQDSVQNPDIWNEFDKISWDLSRDKEFPFYKGSHGDWIDFLDSKLPLRTNDVLLLITSNRTQGLGIQILKEVVHARDMLHWIYKVFDMPVNCRVCSPEIVKWIQGEIKDRWFSPEKERLLRDFRDNRCTVRDLLGDHCFWEGLCRIGDSSVLNISFGS